MVKDLPFVGRTIYKDTISTHKDFVSNPPFKKGAGRSPLSPEFPFLGETEHMKAFKPFKTKPGNNLRQ